MKRNKLARWVGCGMLIALSPHAVTGQQPFQHSYLDGSEQKHVGQKGGGKVGAGTVDRPPHRRWCGAHPPLAPVLQPASVLRVEGPARRVRLRVEQESGAQFEPESGGEREDEIAQLKADIQRLDQRVNDLFQSLQLLVRKLGE